MRRQRFRLIASHRRHAQQLHHHAVNGGKAKVTEYSFDVPGQMIRTTEGEGRIFAAIDGVMVQLLRVPAMAGNEAESLAAHRKTEVEFLEKNGGVIAPSSVCAHFGTPHEEWKAEFKGKNVSTFLTVKIEDSILVLVVGSNAKSPKGQADRQLAGICETLSTQVASG
jgi:hypothetical protein